MGPHPVRTVRGSLPAAAAALSSCDRDDMAYKAQNIGYVARYRKHLPSFFSWIIKKGFLWKDDIVGVDIAAWERDLNV